MTPQHHTIRRCSSLGWVPHAFKRLRGPFKCRRGPFKWSPWPAPRRLSAPYACGRDAVSDDSTGRLNQHAERPATAHSNVWATTLGGGQPAPPHPPAQPQDPLAPLVGPLCHGGCSAPSQPPVGFAQRGSESAPRHDL